MKFRIAQCADFRGTAGTLRVSAPSLCDDVRWFDPLAALRCRAVDAILGVVFLVLAIPEDFELQVEEMVHMLERNMLFGAAARRHVSRISHRHLKNPLQAIVTHSMAAAKLRRSCGRYII